MTADQPLDIPSLQDLVCATFPTEAYQDIERIIAAEDKRLGGIFRAADAVLSEAGSDVNLRELFQATVRGKRSLITSSACILPNCLADDEILQNRDGYAYISNGETEIEFTAIATLRFEGKTTRFCIMSQRVYDEQGQEWLISQPVLMLDPEVMRDIFQYDAPCAKGALQDGSMANDTPKILQLYHALCTLSIHDYAHASMLVWNFIAASGVSIPTSLEEWQTKCLQTNQANENAGQLILEIVPGLLHADTVQKLSPSGNFAEHIERIAQSYMEQVEALGAPLLSSRREAEEQRLHGVADKAIEEYHGKYPQWLRNIRQKLGMEPTVDAVVARHFKRNGNEIEAGLREDIASLQDYLVFNLIRPVRAMLSADSPTVERLFGTFRDQDAVNNLNAFYDRVHEQPEVSWAGEKVHYSKVIEEYREGISPTSGPSR